MGDGQFNRPAGIWFDPENNTLYIADTKNNRIQTFDTNGTFIGKWGTFGTGNGQFDNPTSIGVSSFTGNIFVVDTGNKRIQEFDQDGNFVAVLSSTSLKRPVGIAFDNAGKVYVIDKDNAKVLVFGESTVGQQTTNAVNNSSSNTDKQGQSVNTPAKKSKVSVADKTKTASSSDNKTQTSEATGTFKLKVNLKDTGFAEVGKYFVYVNVYGSKRLTQDKEIDISNQICPGDTTSKCYTPAGTFSFSAVDVPLDSKIEVCVKSPFKDLQNCEQGKNTNKSGPELIEVSVPN